MLYPAELRALPDLPYHRHAGSASRRSALVGAALVLLLCRTAAANEPVRVARIIRADEWLLADGREVRLASIVVPDEPETLGAAAGKLMEAFAGRAVTIGGSRIDRYGRLLATVHDERANDARALLLRAGLAVVRAGDESPAMLEKLLVEEGAARAAGRGIWGEMDQARVPATAVAGRIGRFAYVEGAVAAVSSRREATFLDFGQDWRTDFTVRIRQEDLKRFMAAGIDPAILVGRKVMARGWPFLSAGPMLEARDPLELQSVP